MGRQREVGADGRRGSHRSGALPSAIQPSRQPYAAVCRDTTANTADASLSTFSPRDGACARADGPGPAVGKGGGGGGG